MRVTVSHNKSADEVKRLVNRGFDDIFKGMPVGPVQLSNEQRTWVGDTLNFSFDAQAAFITVPVKGWIRVEQQQVTIEVELPTFFQNMIPEEKVKTSLEAGVKGLLT